VGFRWVIQVAACDWSAGLVKSAAEGGRRTKVSRIRLENTRLQKELAKVLCEREVGTRCPGLKKKAAMGKQVLGRLR